MPRKRRVFNKGSKTDSVMEFILSHKGREVAARTVADSLGLDRKVVATLLSRLASEGRVAKVGRGLYSVKGKVGASRPPTVRRLVAKAEDGWREAYQQITQEIGQALGPASRRIDKVVSGQRASSFRNRTEELVKVIKADMGGRLALDMVQPILESIFGENGRETARRLCFPAGGGGQ